MSIQKSSYEGMDWVKALQAAQKPKDPTADLGQQDEASLVENALESTAQVAFGLRVDPETKHEALNRAAKEISSNAADIQKMSAANHIRTRIATEGIDPISLGVHVRDDQGKLHPITKEEWEGASDARWVEHVATKAALEYEKQVKRAWEMNALQPSQNLSSKFDPATAHDGKIMSSTGANEETRGRSNQLPAAAASIFDPFRLDRFATQETAHDKSVREHKEGVAAREAMKKAELEGTIDPNAPAPMKDGQISRSGGEDSSVFQQRAPRNQISMLDVDSSMANLSQEEMKEKLAQVFTRIEDNGTKIRESNKTRLEEIRGKQDKDRSWEEVRGPVTTSQLMSKLITDDMAKNFTPAPIVAKEEAPKIPASELTKKLAELFTCPKGGQ